MLTDFQRANRAKLADYLAALPPTYAAFDMGTYYGVGRMEDPDEGIHEYKDELCPAEVREGDFDLNPANECGAAACALGHGPAAGIRLTDDDRTWDDYGVRAFGGHPRDGEDGTLMFGTFHENCPYAAAERIRSTLQ